MIWPNEGPCATISPEAAIARHMLVGGARASSPAIQIRSIFCKTLLPFQCRPPSLPDLRASSLDPLLSCSSSLMWWSQVSRV